MSAVGSNQSTPVREVPHLLDEDGHPNGTPIGVRFTSSVNQETPPNSPPTRWYRKDLAETPAASRRPWRDPPKRKRTIPEEQTDGWECTKKRVGKAAVSVLGVTGDIVHETLVVASDVLEYVPLPGLAPAAKILLKIWDTLQLVDMNRLAFLRLTERCADILISIRQEVYEAGDYVGDELAAPINKLTSAFVAVHYFFLKQAKRPFLKRYLKRDEILGEIRERDVDLSDALSLFSLSIQIRILRQVQDAERQRAKETKDLLDSIKGLQAGSNTEVIVPIQTRTKTETMSLTMPVPMVTNNPTSAPTNSPDSSPDVLRSLRALHDFQNEHDRDRDLEDLARLIRSALSSSSDVEVLKVLQVQRDDMPEAIKTLQRALERLLDQRGTDVQREKVERTGKLGKSKSMRKRERQKDKEGNESGSYDEDYWTKITLHREFLENGIDALKRMSKGVDAINLPSWTITRYEVDRDEKIGIGFFSDVYKGTWHLRTVAIKVLADCTPRELFRREIEIWKSLKHENVLELFGASSASGDPPWFFVSPYEKNGNLIQFLKRVAGRGGSVDLQSSGENRSPVTKGSSLQVNSSWTKGRMATVPGGSNGYGKPLLPSKSSGGLKITREGDLFRYMLEIATGMAYLHANGVLHGDLKGANVLVDDSMRCLVSDFGQSELKSEVYRISRTPSPHGTLRWQAPELMSGSSQLSLTPQMDVYSYAILCVEILGMGRMPWPLMDDDAVRRFVLHDNTRPPIPHSPFDTKPLHDLLHFCWNNDPDLRPPFMKIVEEVMAVKKNFVETSHVHLPSPSVDLSARSPGAASLGSEEVPARPSPDMWPIPLVDQSTPRAYASGRALPSESSPRTATHGLMATDNQNSPSMIPLPLPIDGPHFEATVPELPSIDDHNVPMPVIYTPSSSRSSSLRSDPSSRRLLDDIGLDLRGLDFNRGGAYHSPRPTDELTAMVWDERRYRLLLEHSFHPSLTLPLWEPSPIAIGAVGYLSKPTGSFMTLFNSLEPENAFIPAARGLPSLYGYGKVNTGSQRQVKRNAAQRGIDAMIGFLTVMGMGEKDAPLSVARRQSFPLRAGHKAAYMYTETTLYHYIERLEVPKKWFKANIDAIIKIYGATHNIQKEDLYLVIGTLDTPDYALFVSHSHPDGQAYFNVYSAPRQGQPWGCFTTDTSVPSGPSYQDSMVSTPVSTSRVSTTGDGGWKTVVIARLRFKPDVLEPTSL